MGNLQGTELMEMSKKHLGRGIAHHVVCRLGGPGSESLATCKGEALKRLSML